MEEADYSLMVSRYVEAARPGVFGTLFDVGSSFMSMVMPDSKTSMSRS